MNSNKFFFYAAGDLMDCLAQLSRTTESCLRDAEDVLCRKHDYPPATDPLAAIRYYDLPLIAKKIRHLMAAFDILCEEAGGEQPFLLAWQALVAPRRVRRRLQRFLDRIPPEQWQQPPG